MKIIISLFLLFPAGRVFAEMPDFNAFYLNTSSFSSPQFELKKLKKTIVRPSRTENRKEKSSRKYVSLSGYLNISGSGFIPSGGGYATVYLQGNVRLTGGDGYRTDTVYISEPCSFFARPNQYVSQYVYVNKTVSVYKDGKYAGTANISASIPVSGWASSSYINLSGGSYVNASAYVDDTAKTLKKNK